MFNNNESTGDYEALDIVSMQLSANKEIDYVDPYGLDYKV